MYQTTELRAARPYGLKGIADQNVSGKKNKKREQLAKQYARLYTMYISRA